MPIFAKWRNIATEAQQFEKGEEISFVRDSRGNWIDEKTGEIFSTADEVEDGDDNADA